MREADQILNDFEQLSIFWIDSELDEFSSLFEEMNEKCLSTLEFEAEDGAMPEEEFRDSVEKIFSQIQNYWDELGQKLQLEL
jgi:succinate dehydrogenase flavin-adding protein (antitoxin of CptAB toxin-antitoxin module)